MSVVLSEYRENEYMVVKDGVTKCRHMPLEKARIFASSLSGDNDYVDETRSNPKKTKKTEKSKG